MAHKVTTRDLERLLSGDSRFAFIDVREAGEHNSSHIPGASLIPRRRLEFQMLESVPFPGVPVVVYDDDGRRAALAAATLERMGFTNVSTLEGGINRWVSDSLPTEWGTNVPSKDFGEKMEVVHHVPEIDADELGRMVSRGDKLVILDSRTPEEYRRVAIPGGRSVPGGELAYRITDITKDLDPDTTVVVNCAGRTRSIIGTRVLQRMGLDNVCGLRNGTAGWVLAGLQLEQGADRVNLPEPSAEGIAAAEAYAARLAVEDGVRYLDAPALREVMARADREPVYLIDVRTEDEFRVGHIPGFRWFPGGQAVQRSDDVAVVRNAVIVFCCDGKARSTMTASWYRQMGYPEVYAVDGGTSAWAAAGGALEPGLPQERPFGLEEAASRVRLVTPRELNDGDWPVTIFVNTSEDFARGHTPGGRWAPRGWLEFQIDGITPSKATPIAVTCRDGLSAPLAGAALRDLGYETVGVLEGGMEAWREAGFEAETGLSGVMTPPTDMVIMGVERNPAEMMNYLRWETELGEKYHEQAG